MFYGTKSRVKHDYYNSYSNPKHSNGNPNILNTLIKILVILFLITLIISGYIFITKEQKVIKQEAPQTKMMVYEVKEEPFVEEMARGIVTPELKKERSLSIEEITQIVQIVITQLNHTEKKKNLSEELLVQKDLTEKDDNSYVKALMSMDVDTDNRLQASDKNKLVLKDVNHYNKVVVQTDNRIQETINDPMVKLSSEMSDALEGIEEGEEQSDYAQLISKELDVRSNEMRVIVVQQGDTLSRIAYRAYGDYDAYPKIFVANPEVIENPDQIFVGQKLRIPL